MNSPNDAARLAGGAGPRLGIIGGGQLAKMTALAALNLGCDVAILERNPESPALRLAADWMIGDWDDPAVLLAFAKRAHVLTLENEFVQASSLAAVEQAGHTLYPQAAAIGRVQDKLLQKEMLTRAGLPVAPFCPVADHAEVARAGEEFGWPIILKARRNGYDGKGNVTVRTPREIEAGWERLQGGRNALYVEAFCPFVAELAVIVTRGRQGEVRAYPVVESVQRDHICHQVLAPASLPPGVADRAMAIAQAAVQAVDGVGSFGIELFLLGEGHLLVNEMAPRVHNSGHYTIEACDCSQFENHVRAVLGWPLGSTKMRQPAAVMLNLLGDGSGSGMPAGWSEALAVEGAHLHLYGKLRAAPGRKMGHVTALGGTVDEALERAARMVSCLRFTKTA